MNRVEDIIAAVDTLPPLPDTMVRLMSVVSDPDSSIAEIVSVIKYDEVITGEVLKVCNSAYFGLSRRISNLTEATVCLGTARLMQLVMAIHSNALLGREHKGYGMLSGYLWQHSVATAIACETLGEKLALPNAGLLFTMGLMHDIGKVVLNEYVGTEYAKITQLVDDEGYAFNEAERIVLGYDHCEAGGLLGEKWQLPSEFIGAIRWHHEPAGAPGADPLIDVVYLANIWTVMLGFGRGHDGLNYRADEQALARRGLTEADMQIVGTDVVLKLKQVKEMFTGKQDA